MEVVGTSHRPDLPGAHHAGYRGGVKSVNQKTGIMAGKAEQMATSAVAGEGQCPPGTLTVEVIFQISSGGLRIADLELHRGPDGHSVTDRQCPGGTVGAHDRPYKEVAGTKGLQMFIDDYPEMEAVPDSAGGRLIGSI